MGNIASLGLDGFDPEAYERELSAIIADIGELDELDGRSLDRIVRRHPKDGRGFFSKREILAGVRFLVHRRGQGLDLPALTRKLRTCPTRSLSGILPVTVLTQPYPCPGQCVFCPNDLRMPKSYLADEPGCQRAEAHRFDPYLQTWSRLLAYQQMGHPTDKVELLVLGGTWSAYPEAYQCWFTRRCFDALDDFGAGRDGRGGVEPAAPDFRPLDRRHPLARRAGRYNALVTGHLREAGWEAPGDEAESKGWRDLARAQQRNESSAVRCVGLVFETRPDAVSREEVIRLRRLGATKVQLGIQSLDDEVLARNRRGHDVAASRRAIAWLRRAGFKIHLHWMPNLLGSTPARDALDFARLFEDPAFRPDELKLYPCSLIDGTELMEHHAAGRWQPYPREKLADLLAGCLERVPRYCRVTRVVRDIPSPDIVVGNRETNLREVAEGRLRARGVRALEIRAREVRGTPIRPEELRQRSLGFETTTGRERFLELVTPEDRLAAFLRLSLPATDAFLPELLGCALIRELHVYGEVVGLGQSDAGIPQHSGLGRRLVAAAVREARRAGFARLAVISAVGTREYYRRLGFQDGTLYQSVDLSREG